MDNLSIPVLTTKRRPTRTRVNSAKRVNVANLRPVPKEPQNASVEIIPVLNVKLALQNARSLKNKPFVMNDFICTHNLDFLLLTETWLEKSTSCITLIEATPPHFNFISTERQNKQGGGIAIIYKALFQCQKTALGDFASFEYLSAVLKCSSDILLLTIYRPPRLSAPLFLEEFGELLSNVCVEYESVIISGDFNLHVDNLENAYAKEFLSLIDTFSLTQHVRGPTHNQGHTLDLVITKGLNACATVKDFGFSDHFCVFFQISMHPHVQRESVTVKKRIIKDGTAALFQQALSETQSQTSESADDLMVNFNSRMTHIMDVIAPVKIKTVGHQKAPWKMNPTVKLQKQECRRAERRWRKSKLEVHYQIYKHMLSKYNLEISKARQSFFSDIINRNINNARVLFGTVEKLTNPPHQMPSEFLSVSKCNEFASFFKGKIDKIRTNILTQVQPAQNVDQFPTVKLNLNLMTTFHLVNLDILNRTVQSLSSSTSDLDILPTAFFKSILHLISHDVLQIINTSLQTGTFPACLKEAVVKPLLKKNNLDALVLNNYRPISNLPFIGKIIEKIVFNQLTAFLTSNSYFDEFQSGFRANHSTETALTKVMNDIRLNNDVGKTSVLVLLDLSAAFDTVDHTILLHRLEHWVGFTGIVINWLKSYLQQRSFFVAIGSHTSSPMSLNCGVPQGSILGPLLFNLYMLPLGQIIKNNSINYHSYADDTQLYLSMSPNDYAPLKSLYHCIDQINNWMSHNFLQLNTDKTEVIIFGKKEERLKIATFLETKGLKARDTVKNLGVLIDSDLNFNSHMKSITKSSFYHLKNISKHRGLMLKHDLEKIMHALMTSRIDYCNSLFTGLPKKTIKQLQLIQNAAARVLTKTRKFDHITPILRSLHWLPVSYRIDFKALLLVFKSLNGMGPSYLLDMFQRYAPTRSLRSMENNLLVIPKVKTKCGEAAFSSYAAKLWNQLPDDVKNAPTVDSFKSRLKTKLFSDAFP